MPPMSKSSLSQRYPTAPLPPMAPPVQGGGYQPPGGPMPPMPPAPAASGNQYPPHSATSGFPPNNSQQNLTSRLGGLSLGQGADCIDLLQNRHILPPKAVKAPKPKLQAELWNNYNC